MQIADSDNLSKRMHYYQRLIDIGKLKHGQYYSSLSDSFIIFICTFDRFNAGKGTADDVSPTLKAFLDYVDRGIISSDFVQKLDTA